jgi:hypothetical protein
MDFGRSTIASFVQSLTLHIGGASITGCSLRFISTRRSALVAIHERTSSRSPSIILQLIASFRGCDFLGLTWADKWDLSDEGDLNGLVRIRWKYHTLLPGIHRHYFDSASMD